MKTFNQFINERQRPAELKVTIDFDDKKTHATVTFYDDRVISNPSTSDIMSITIGRDSFIGTSDTATHKSGKRVNKFETDAGRIIWVTPDLSAAYSD